MKSVTMGNKHAMEQLEKAKTNRDKAVNEQTQETKQVFNDHEFNFARTQRNVALTFAMNSRKADFTAEDVVGDAQKYFEFLISDGFYEYTEKSTIISA